MIQTLSELLVASVRRNSSGQIKFLNFIIKGCSATIAIHFQSKFIKWKVSLTVEAGGCYGHFKRGNSALVVNYRPINNLTNIS
jgi:hypothetical protein